MKYFEILRKLGDRSPEVTEQVIALWGTAAFVEYIHGLARRHAASDMDQFQSLLTVAEELKRAHLEDFPQIEWGQSPEELEIRATAEFPIINERFPHIGRRLIQTWGSFAFYVYSDTLFTDTRGGTRRGFPLDILSAITSIVRIHEQRYPRLDPRWSDVWIHSV